MTNTVTDARVMHPSTTSYPYLSPMTVSSTMSTVTSLTSSGSARYGSGIVSRLSASPGPGISGLLENLPTLSSQTFTSALNVVVNPVSSSVVTSPFSAVTSQFSVTKPRMSSQSISSASNLQQHVTRTSAYNSHHTASRPLSSFTDFSSGAFFTSANSDTVVTSHSSGGAHGAPPTSARNEPKSSFGFLSSIYQYMSPSIATTTTHSGLSSIVSDAVVGNSRASRGVYSRTWQKPWL